MFVENGEKAEYFAPQTGSKIDPFMHPATFEFRMGRQTGSTRPEWEFTRLSSTCFQTRALTPAPGQSRLGAERNWIGNLRLAGSG